MPGNKSINIFFEDGTEFAELEAVQKGYRTNVIVEIDNIFYKINIISLHRLTQEFIEIKKQGKFYNMEPNLLLVEDCSKQEIIETVLYQVKHSCFFEETKPYCDFNANENMRVYSNAWFNTP
jgi:hypothetical protein